MCPANVSATHCHPPNTSSNTPTYTQVISLVVHVYQKVYTELYVYLWDIFAHKYVFIATAHIHLVEPVNDDVSSYSLSFWFLTAAWRMHALPWHMLRNVYLETLILQMVPLCDGMTRRDEHVRPVQFGRIRQVRPDRDSADEVVTREPIIVHHRYDYVRVLYRHSGLPIVNRTNPPQTPLMKGCPFKRQLLRDQPTTCKLFYAYLNPLRRHVKIKRFFVVRIERVHFCGCFAFLHSLVPVH
jgi:hypothetical protein